MTLNMLFFTITFKRNKETAEEYLHRERIEKLRDEYMNKAIMYRMM
ncbi:YrzI family small protein [Peribacillus sp. SCS-155]